MINLKIISLSLSSNCSNSPYLDGYRCIFKKINLMNRVCIFPTTGYFTKSTIFSNSEDFRHLTFNYILLYSLNVFTKTGYFIFTT